MRGTEEYWDIPSDELRIQTNFLGDRTIARANAADEPEDERNHDKFLKGL